MPETLPECPHDGESGVFDKWVVLNDGRRYARYSCSKCGTPFDITEEEYKKLRGTIPTKTEIETISLMHRLLEHELDQTKHPDILKYACWYWNVREVCLRELNDPIEFFLRLCKNDICSGV